MFRPTRTDVRRGNILLVTMLLLALFAIVGTTLVYYAMAAAERAKIQGQYMSTGDTEFPDDGRAALNAFLAKWIYADQDTGSGLVNAMRGHDLMATMYGRQIGATIAFNGVGTFDEATTVGVPRRLMMNYRLFPGMAMIHDPEYSNTTGRLPTDPAPSGAYVPKSAPYTYADINNSFLAVMCPATGEVLVPSFYRSQAFRDAGQPATATGLEPSNPNWTNATGKYLTLRPRPADMGPGFPYVPANADGTYTGDVQNLPGGFLQYPNPYPTNPSLAGKSVARNDSIWIDINAPIMTAPDGRRYKMLVAPLILDLDGRLNLSVHGNRMLPRAGGLPPTDFVHTSGVGIGPHEIGLERVLGMTEAAQVIAARGQAQNRGGQAQNSFARLPGGNQIPVYAQIPWGGFVPMSPLQAPLQIPSYATTNPFATSPTYTSGYDYQNLPFANHPTLFNPFEWPSVANGAFPRAFPLGDTKLLSLRYAFAPAFYSALDVGNYAPIFLRGNPASFLLPNPNPPGQATVSNYRLDPAHANRHLVTTFSADLDRPRLMPMYLNQVAGATPGTGTALYRDAASGLLVNPWTGNMFPNPTTSIPGQITDFGVNGTTNQWQNVRLALGAIDLNRTLADYRTDPTLPLAPNNMGNEVNARLDRQRFARDIFARLVIATGAQAQVATAPTTVGPITYNTGDVIISATPGTPEFDALRQLAQLAANIVDYLDSDDINATFVWNPQNPGDPHNAANFTPIQIFNRVVFGVEKPRLTLTEAYAEVTNDPADLTADAHVRFWLEFQNATTAVTNAAFGDGSVKLQYTTELPLGMPSFNPYQVEIVQNTKSTPTVSQGLRDPGSAAVNIKGDVGVLADLRFNFTAAGGLRVVAPANGVAGNGIVVCNAIVPSATPNLEFNPTFAAGTTIVGAAPGNADALTYKTPLAGALTGNKLFTNLKDHVVLLRRLANPHLPGPTNTNPYITIDFMDNVSTFDAIKRAAGGTMDRNQKSATQTGYDPTDLPAPAGDTIIRRHSLGKVQPYAGMCNPEPSGQDNPKFSFPNSLVLAQILGDNTGTAQTGVQHTLGLQNSRTPTAPAAQTYIPGVVAPASDARLFNAGIAKTDTLMTPYDWFIHLDRQVINQLELLHVSAGRPHEQTLQFIVPNTLPPGTGKDVVKYAGAAQWLPAVAPHPYATPTATGTPSGLHRAFELLRTQPYGQNAFGGRLAGRININTIQDKRVWDALFDAQSGNGFTQGPATTVGTVDWMWNNLMASRTVNMVQKTDAAGNPLNHLTPVPGASIFDMNAGVTTPYDRPFLPFGAPHMTPGSTFALGGVVGLDDTILRRTLNTPTPMLWNTNVANPYLQAEAARKIMNNVTTVSNSFAVYLTVGYFEVTSETPMGPGLPNDVKLGREFYREVPADLRHKFFCIVDRSQIGLDPQQFASNTFVHAGSPGTATAGSRPFFTTVETSAAPSGGAADTLFVSAASGNTTAVQVYSDGQVVNIVPGGPNAWLVVGTGATREIVNVTAVNFSPPPAPPAAPGPGIAILTITPLKFTHAIGECVSNIVPGNPGPQPGFDVANTAQYGGIIQHWSRVP